MLMRKPEESKADAQHQPADAQRGELVAAAVEADALEVDVRDFGELVDEHQPLALAYKQFHYFVDGAEHDEAVQRNHNPIHNL